MARTDDDGPLAIVRTAGWLTLLGLALVACAFGALGLLFADGWRWLAGRLR